MSDFVTILISQRYWFAVCTLIVCAFAMWGMQYSRMEVGYDTILSENDPLKAEVDQTEKDFPPSTSVLFAFEALPDIFTLEALRAMEALTERYTEVDGALAVGSLLNRRLNDAHAARYDRDYLIPQLEGLTQDDLADIRALALNDEDLTESLLASTGDMAIARIKFSVADDQAERLKVAASVINLRDDLRALFPGIDIYTLGGVMFEHDSYYAQIKDRQLLTPLVIGIGIVLLWFCLKSFTYAVSLFSIAVATIGLSVGTFGWLDIPFNQTSGLGPLVVLVIAIADGIHIAAVYAQGLNAGMHKFDAMRDSLNINLQPVTLATVTTSIGFLSLNYSSSPGIYGFGNIVAIGVWWAYIVTLGILPAILLLLPTRRTIQPLGVQAFIEWVKKQVSTRGVTWLWGSSALIVTTLALLPLNNIDFNRYSFIDEDSDFHHVLEAFRNKIGNDQSLVYSVHSGDYYGITQPAFLRQVEELSKWIESQPDASFVTSYTDYLRARNKAEHDDDPAWDVLPTDQLQVIDYLVGYQLVQEIEPSLEPIFNADYSAIRLVVGTSNLSNQQLLNLNARIDNWIEEHLDHKYAVLHGDTSILFARLNRAITLELMQGFSLSFLFITLTMLVGLRSIKYGLISIMPNLFPATIVFGIWGVFVGEISPYILMLFSISIGLVVDDSVHILSKYIHAKRQGSSPSAAVTYSLDRAGSAITITTLSLAVGTVILVFSNTFHFQNLAMLLTPIIIVALLLDLLFLPPLLIRLDERRARPTAKLGSQTVGNA